MAQILKGAPVVAAMNEANAARCAALKEKGIVPTLAVVRVGAREDDISYEKGIVTRCGKVGVEVRQFHLAEDVTQEELLDVIRQINEDASVHGCLIFRPLPKRFDDRRVQEALAPEKDVDGITDGSMAGVFTNMPIGYPPCTAQACLEILKHYNVPLSGKRAVVVGRSLVVGKPAAMMLDRENATVTLCNSRTRDLPALCRQIRRDILSMTHAAGSGHPGGSLSAVEILVSLYFGQMRLDPARPDDPNRDRFLLSKGHAAPLLYSVLARRGYFDPALLPTLRQLGSPLQGHPHMAKLPGLDCSSGSLGQGLSIANGLALAARRTGRTYRTYCLLGDGELQEGQVWEAAMTAAHFALDTVCAIVDDNGVQLDGPTCEVMNVAPLADKFRAFGWQVLSVDGHSLDALAEAFRQAAATRGRPTVLLARTVKGKGVSFMEGQPAWHGKAPNDQELAAALAELAEGGTL